MEKKVGNSWALEELLLKGEKENVASKLILGLNEAQRKTFPASLLSLLLR